ncbi:MAG: hypothetical protein V4555_00980, partial [Acidobacteriota bacterium]
EESGAREGLQKFAAVHCAPLVRRTPVPPGLKPLLLLMGLTIFKAGGCVKKPSKIAKLTSAAEAAVQWGHLRHD